MYIIFFFKKVQLYLLTLICNASGCIHSIVLNFLYILLCYKCNFYGNFEDLERFCIIIALKEKKKISIKYCNKIFVIIIATKYKRE